MVSKQERQNSNSRVCKYQEWTERLLQGTISYTSSKINKIIITESLNTVLLNFFMLPTLSIPSCNECQNKLEFSVEKTHLLLKYSD